MKRDMQVRRFFAAEYRSEVDGEGDQKPMIDGIAAVYNEIYVNEFWGFREQLVPGCFTETLKDCDCRALFNHNPDYVLGRNTSGTLRLIDSEGGLRFVVEPPDTQWAKDLQVSMKRGDINQCSFGFEIVEEDVDKSDPKMPLFTIKKVRLHDVSVVTFPAYQTTSAEARSLLADLDIDVDALAQAAHQLRSGVGEDKDREVLSGIMARLERCVGTSGVHPEDGHVGDLQRLRMELDLLL